jgi:dihydrofolate reductase
MGVKLYEIWRKSEGKSLRRLKTMKIQSKRSIVLYIAMSLDGYIAREDGNVDWLYDVEGKGDNGYSSFYDSVDTLIMGNKTYEHTKELATEFPYQSKECYVFSRKQDGNDENVHFVNGSFSGFIQKLQARNNGGKVWIVGGAEIVDMFMKEKLVTEFIISIIPTVLGKGIPLFKYDNPEINLNLNHIKQYGQIAQLHYEKI